jgi:diguanylate cyclase (GGDEF)-like protein/PAS domain S-box-containing protein
LTTDTPVLQTVSPENIQALYTNTPAILHAIDADGRILCVSDKWLSVMGYPRDEVIGRTLLEFMTPDSRRYATTERLQEFFATGSCERIPYDLVTKSGAIVNVLISATLERNADGSPRQTLAVLENLTESHEVYRTLAAERRRLRQIISGTGAGTWEWNVQTGETIFNQRWAEIIGHDIADLSPTTIDTWLGAAHPDDLAESERKLLAHFAGESPIYDCEARMRHKDGHWVWVLDRGRVFTWTEDGKPEWMFGTHMDITSLKQQQEDLRISREMLDRTNSVAGIGGWEVYPETGVINWSDETCRIHGVEPGHVPTMEEAINYYAPEARPIITAAVERGMATGESWDLELPFIKAGGERIWVRAVGTVDAQHGKPLRITGAFQDITERVARQQAIEETRERILIATEDGGVGIWDLEIATGKVSWDVNAATIHGADAAQTTFAGWAERIHPEDRESVAAAVETASTSAGNMDIEYRVLLADGKFGHVRASAHCRKIGQAGLKRLIGVCWDVTHEREMARKLAEQHELMRVTLDSIGDAVITTDTRGQILWLNPVAERMTGWQAEDAKGRPSAEVFHIVSEDTRNPAPDPIGACLMLRETVGLDHNTVLLARDGTEYGIEDSAAPIISVDGAMLGAVLVFHDVSEQRRLSREMRYRATHDPLTGLLNRGEFDRRLEALVARATAHPAPVEDGTDNSLSGQVLLYIDLDQFKVVNDSCGHAAGDLLLKQISVILKDVVKPADVARLGGDEFAVLLENCAVEAAFQLSKRLCARIGDYRFESPQGRFRVGASIGLVSIGDETKSASAALKAADAACYAAKEAGRNRVHMWDSGDRTLVERSAQMRWATRIEQALDEDRFIIYGQRINDLSGDATGGQVMELLLRMVDTDGRIIPPNAFFPAAERFSLASRIDDWMLERTLELIGNATLTGFRGLICLNLSGQSIGDPDFHKRSLERLRRSTQSVRDRLCVEITETAAIANMIDASEFIQNLRRMGVRVSLDDFGAGASSFGYLKQLSVDFLKIDGSFVRNLPSDALSEAAIRCFVEIARIVGVKTIAEFIEDGATQDLLRDMHVDYGQGFHLHQPEPLDRMLATLSPLQEDTFAPQPAAASSAGPRDRGVVRSARLFSGPRGNLR